MKLEFTLAKKFNGNNVKGLELRSASLGRAVVFNTSGTGYEKVRDAYEAFKGESEFLGKEVSLKLKGIGKAAREEIQGLLNSAFDLLQSTSGNDFLYLLKHLR